MASNKSKPSLNVINLNADGYRYRCYFPFYRRSCITDAKSLFRNSSGFTSDLQRAARWLVDLGITTVAMELTGIYWLPLMEILEAHGMAVNAGQRTSRKKSTIWTKNGCLGLSVVATLAQLRLT